MNERRQDQRTPFVEAAWIQAGADVIECVVVEMSRSGARIEISAPLPTMFDLTLTGDDGKMRRQCQLVWQEGHWAGVNFI
jgi:PilZ domain